MKRRRKPSSKENQNRSDKYYNHSILSIKSGCINIFIQFLILIFCAQNLDRSSITHIYGRWMSVHKYLWVSTTIISDWWIKECENVR